MDIVTHPQLLECIPDAAELSADVLVVVEPGTPLGFANVRDARSQVLELEGRRRSKLLNQLNGQVGALDGRETLPSGTASSNIVEDL